MDSQSDPPDEPETKPSVEALKPEIFDAIGAHLREHGREDWHLLRERPEYAHVIGSISGATGDRRFWRWVRKVREDMPPDHTKPHDGRYANQAHKAWSAEEARRATEEIGVPISASFFMKSGADGLQTLSMYEALQDAWTDLRSALEVIERETFKPRDKAMLLAANAQARIKVMDAAVRIHRQLSDTDALHARYRALFQLILEDCAPFPDLQAALLRRLKDSNSPPPSFPV